MEIELAELCVFQPPPTITSVDRKEVIARIRKHAQQHGFNVATLSSNTARAILICERSRASPSRVLDDCPFRCLLPTGQRYIVEEPCHNHDPNPDYLPSIKQTAYSPWQIPRHQTRTFLRSSPRPVHVPNVPQDLTHVFTPQSSTPMICKRRKSPLHYLSINSFPNPLTTSEAARDVRALPHNHTTGDDVTHSKFTLPPPLEGAGEYDTDEDIAEHETPTKQNSLEDEDIDTEPDGFEQAAATRQAVRELRICPLCSCPFPESIRGHWLRIVQRATDMTIRIQQRICEAHTEISCIQEWRSNGLPMDSSGNPSIDWDDLVSKGQRMLVRVHADILDNVGQLYSLDAFSDFLRKCEQSHCSVAQANKTARTETLSSEHQVHHFGYFGFDAMVHLMPILKSSSLTARISLRDIPRLRETRYAGQQQSEMNDLIYERVFIPEILLRIVMEDRSLSKD